MFFPRNWSIRDSLCAYRGTRRHNHLEKEMNTWEDDEKLYRSALDPNARVAREIESLREEVATLKREILSLKKALLG